MAYIDVLGVTTSSIKVQMAGLDTEYSKSDRVCTWYLNGTKKGTSKLGANVSSGGAYIFDGLSAGTEYNISVSITGTNWANPVELDTTSETEAISIEPWSWSYSNGSASDSQTRSAYNAVCNNGSIENFSYLVWNDMVDKVKEILDAYGDSWNSKYASYSSTKMSSSNRNLTAARFNSLRYNIGIRYSTGVSEVSKGDTVYGYYFIALADSINGWLG